MDKMNDLCDKNIWKDLYPELVLFTRKLVTLYGLSEDCYKDYLQEAIRRVLDGTRKWDPQRVDLAGLVKGTVRSIVSKDFDTAFNKKWQHTCRDNGGKESNPIEKVKSDELPSDFLMNVSMLEKFLIDQFQDDEDAQMVLLGLFDLLKPSEIADDYEIPIEKVRSILKRIRRRALQYRKTEIV